MTLIVDWLFGVAFLVHFLLIGGDVLATIAVGWGILWEAAEQPPERHRIAKKLVIWGIVAETVCSICLFAFDESISQGQEKKLTAQGSELTSAKTELAAATKRTGELEDSGKQSDLKITSLEADAKASEQKIAEANKIAKQAIDHAVSLGFKYGNLDEFVKKKAAEIDLAKSELVKNTASLNKARDDSVLASESAKKYLEDASVFLSQGKVLQEQLKTQLADANRESQSLKNQINDLDKVVGARHITDAQKSILTTFLLDKPKGRLTIFALNSAVDAKSYSDEIAAAFKISGWAVTVEIGRGNLWDDGGSGIWIHYGGNAIPESNKILRSALTVIDISTKDGMHSDSGFDRLPAQSILVIGNKN